MPDHVKSTREPGDQLSMASTGQHGRCPDVFDDDRSARRVSLATIAREWARMGTFGFGGPPALITLLHRLCVQERRWISETEFQDGIAAANLLPDPAALQLGIYCAWRLRGAAGAVIAGVCFALPGAVVILGLSVLFLAERPSLWLQGAAAGAGAAVTAVAVDAALGLMPASWKRAGKSRAQRARWIGYTLLGGTAAATVGPYLVLVLLACGLTEMAARSRRRPTYHLRSYGALLGLPGLPPWSREAWAALALWHE